VKRRNEATRVLPPTRVRRSEVADWLARTHAEDAEVRRDAVRALCPCHVRRDRRRVWERLLEMVADADRRVRSHVLHALTDGSPKDLEHEVIAAIGRMRNDPDERLRRRVRGILAGYRRTGSWNVG
jgi:hypothetical protein